MFGVDDVAMAATAAAAINYLGTSSTNQANADIAASNNAWSAQQYATRYQTQVADLKAAGLNPAIAYGVSPGPAPTAQQVQFQNPVASATQAATDVASTAGHYQHDVASAGAAEKMQGQIDATTNKINEEIKNVPEEGRRLRAVYINLAEQSAKLAQETQSETVRRKVLEQTVNQLRQQNIITQYDIDAIKSTGAIGRIAREIKPASDIGSDWVDSLMPFKGKKPITTESSGTFYDSKGNPSGGFSRSQTTK